MFLEIIDKPLYLRPVIISKDLLKQFMISAVMES